MNITDIRAELREARRLRSNISVKIVNYKKKNKDTAELENQLQDIRNKIYELTNQEGLAMRVQRTKPAVQGDKRPIQIVEIPESAMIPKGEQSQLKKQANKDAKPVKTETKSWTKAELTACKKQADQILDNNDWHPGYQFRSSEWMFIKHIRTNVLPDSVELEYTIQYKTRNHRVEKVVTKYFNPETIQSLNKYIEHVELWVMLNSGDMDNKDIPFGARFNQIQFEKQGYPEQGWVMYK